MKLKTILKQIIKEEVNKALVENNVELYGAAFLNGKLVDYEGQLTNSQIDDIINSDTFTWIDPTKELTNKKSDKSAFKIDADFLLIINNKRYTLIPSEVKAKLQKIY